MPRPPVDMSSAAIDGRIRRLSQMRRLGLSLQTAKILGPVKDFPVLRESAGEERPETLAAERTLPFSGKPEKV